MRPATIDDLTSEGSTLTHALHLLDLNGLGLNAFSHLLAGRGSRHVRAHGSKGVTLPIELWDMILDLLKQDIGAPDYCLVQASEIQTSRDSNNKNDVANQNALNIVLCTRYKLNLTTEYYQPYECNLTTISRFADVLADPDKYVGNLKYPRPSRMVKETFYVALAGRSRFEAVVPCLMGNITPTDVVRFINNGKCCMCQNDWALCRGCGSPGLEYDYQSERGRYICKAEHTDSVAIVCPLCIGEDLASEQEALLTSRPSPVGERCCLGLDWEEGQLRGWVCRRLYYTNSYRYEDETAEEIELRGRIRESAKVLGCFGRCRF
ncbi:hypothetical protein V8F33_012916 [Rhypophila sp. PSN 637]